MEKLSYKKEYHFPGNIYFKYVGVITEDEAKEFQTNVGFHPHGYGFYDFYVNNTNKTTLWNCSNSCD